MAETEIKKINGKTIADVTARAETDKLGKAKAGLPVDADGNPDHGTDGQYAQSDGAGGLKWGGAPAGAVSSVNGKTGAVSLGAADVGARPATWTPTASEVGALPADTKIPANTSDLTNDSGFITKAVADLVNYYTKSQTYTQAEVNALVSAIPKFAISVVSALPTTDISGTTVYLVKSGSDADLYTEYIYVNGAWEILGSQRVDLTGYATETWVETKLGDYLTAETLTAAIITGALGYTPAKADDVPDVDNTLTTAGAAADAAKVGTELSTLSEAIEEQGEKSVRLITSKTLKVGANMLTDAMVTLGEGWIGTLAEGFTHTSGYTEPLTFAINSADGESFFIEGGCPNTGSTLFRFVIGESYPTDPYDGTSRISWGVKSIGGGDFSIIPESAFSGTITELSCKKIAVDGTDEIVYVFDDVAHTPSQEHISGSWNIQMGADALSNLVNGTRNIALGKSALAKLITGGRNIALGTYTLAAAEYAENNINIGADSGLEVKKAKGCVAIGRTSMGYGTNLVDNIAIGHDALRGTMEESESSGNVAIGPYAGYKCVKKSNVFIGYNAGYSSNSNLNTFVGANAGRVSTGWGNVAIGPNADVNGSYSRSIAIGYNAKATKNNQVVIGEDGITETMLKGDLVIRGTDGVMRQIVFNDDGTCTWKEAT